MRGEAIAGHTNGGVTWGTHRTHVHTHTHTHTRTHARTPPNFFEKTQKKLGCVKWTVSLMK